MAYSNKDLFAQVNFHAVSGLPEDTVVNTLYFQAQGADGAEDVAPDVIADIETAFTGDHGAAAGGPVWQHMSTALSGLVTVKCYVMSDAEPRVPTAIGELDFTAGDLGTSQLPREVAMCLSFHANYTSGGNAARRRGRIYVGPLGSTSNILDTATGGPAASIITALKDMGVWLRDSLTANAVWCVNSDADSTLRPVTEGWVDNAFDTQRRRGQAATARTLF